MSHNTNIQSYDEARIAIHFWYRAREKNIANSIPKLLQFVFFTLDALYDVTRKLPERTHTFDDVPKIDVSRFFVIGFPEYEYYKEIRLTLSLVSDLNFLFRGIKKQGELMEIESIINKMNELTSKFEDIRNFYTHLDERIYDLEKHGVNGVARTNCGINYESNAKNCFHLVVGTGEIHFSDYKKPKEVDIGKSAFDSIFGEAKNLFTELTKNKDPNGRKTFPSAETFYPL